MARKHSENAQGKIGEVMREFKRDRLRNDSGKKVTSHERAGAASTVETRKEGPKGPPRAKAER